MLLKEGYTIQIVGFILYTVYQKHSWFYCASHYFASQILWFLQIKGLQEPNIKHVNLFFISSIADLQRCISFQVIQLYISTRNYFSEFFLLQVITRYWIWLPEPHKRDYQLYFPKITCSFHVSVSHFGN